MPHAYAMSMTRPDEALGLRVPLARRLPSGVVAWNILLFTVSAALCVAYVILVNTSATKGYALRDLEKKVDGLKSETLQLQDTVVTGSSLSALSDRATRLGLVPLDRVDYVEVSNPSYALAK